MRFLLLMIMLVMFCSMISSESSFINTINNTKTVKYEKEFFEQECLNNSIVHLKVFFLINKYTKMYDVSKRVAFRVLKLETGYKGPFDRKYKPKQISRANAYGSMQLLKSTANWVYHDFAPVGTYKLILTKDILLNDIELNINLGIKYLRHLNDKFLSWKYATGYYNTGYKKINSYAIYASG